MIDKLRNMAIFAQMAESGAFRLAADRLGLSASVVSHHLSQLEKGLGELGVQLLYRSTRHVTLTDQVGAFSRSLPEHGRIRRKRAFRPFLCRTRWSAPGCCVRTVFGRPFRC